MEKKKNIHKTTIMSVPKHIAFKMAGGGQVTCLF